MRWTWPSQRACAKKKVRPPPAPLPKERIHRVLLAPLGRKVQPPGLVPSLRDDREPLEPIRVLSGTGYRKEMVQDRSLAECPAGEFIVAREKIAYLPGERREALLLITHAFGEEPVQEGPWWGEIVARGTRAEVELLP